MVINWSKDQVTAFPCPICRGGRAKHHILDVHSAFQEQGILRLYKCAECGTLSFSEVTVPAYEIDVGGRSEDNAEVYGSIKYYIEQGAAPDEMVSPLFWLDPGRIYRYAEIGCGFGFSLDFFRSTMGWEVRGYDPSPAAAAGRTQLQLPITTTYLRRESLQDELPFDLVLASEVIEHIPDPHAFIEDIKGVIAPEGWLVLSTPNAAGVNAGTCPGGLLQILSPGYHLFILSSNALRQLLHAHGFKFLCLKETPSTLTVVASRVPFSADSTHALDRAMYRDYLQNRLDTLNFDQPLAHGFAGRLVKEWVNCGEIGRAMSIMDALTKSYQRVYGIDMDEPETIKVDSLASLDFCRFVAQFPSNLCGLAYRRGFIALHHQQNPRLALAYFVLAESFGKALRKVLNSIGSDDGETEHLVWLSELAAVEAAVACDPLVLIERLDNLRKSLEGHAQLVERRLQADALIAQLFADRVLVGDKELAELLVTELRLETPGALEASATDPQLSIRYALAYGLFHLNYQSDPVVAQSWFKAAMECLRSAPGIDTGFSDTWGQAADLALHLVQCQIIRIFTDAVLSGDLDKASTLVGLIAETGSEEVSSSEIDPLAVAQYAYARGLFALNREGLAVESLTWFSEALQQLQDSWPLQEPNAAKMLHHAVHNARLCALATVQPEAALQECQEMLVDGNLEDKNRLIHCREVFIRLVHAGGYEQARALLPILLSRVDAESDALTPDLAFTIGILHLNYFQAPRAAQEWFERAVSLAPDDSSFKEIARQHLLMAEKMIISTNS